MNVKLNFVFLCFILTACGQKENQQWPGDNKKPILDEGKNDCPISFVSTDSPSELARKSYAMSHLCHLTEEEILKKL